jgi:endonuclease YncB( thermonuclease family)
MQILSTVVVAAVAAGQFVVPGRRSEPLLVTSVVDGRTIQVQSIGRVRLLGIELPRTDRGLAAGSLGKQAKDRLTDLVLHRWVRLEYGGTTRSSSGGHRRAFVWTEDGRFVNAVMVREGLARAALQESERLAELRDAEADARAHRRGIWAAGVQARVWVLAAKLRSASASVSNA